MARHERREDPTLRWWQRPFARLRPSEARSYFLVILVVVGLVGAGIGVVDGSNRNSNLLLGVLALVAGTGLAITIGFMLFRPPSPPDSNFEITAADRDAR